MSYPSYRPRAKKTLSRSSTRITILEYCERKYYLNYYTFALKQDHPDLWKETLILKGLKSIEMRVGEKSHYLLSDYLHDLKKVVKDGGDALSAEEIQSLKDEIKLEMEDEFAESAQRDYKNDEDFFGKFGLSEHFYGTMTDEMLPDAIQKVRNNLDRFIASTWNSKVIDYFQTAKFVYVERPRTRDFDAMKVNVSKLLGFKDITVMAAPDFGVTFSDTDFLILDWKSGKEDIVDEGISDQLKVYALKMLLKKGISTMDGMRIEAHEVYLQNMHTHGGVLTQQDIDGIIEKIQHDVEEQKNFLVDRDPYRNDPVDVIMFRKTSNAKKCEGCTFRDVCQKLA